MASALSLASHFLGTLWLFTESDFATFVIPDTVFGIFGALAGSLLTTNENPNLWEILSRLPSVLLYNWANLLIFDLANQRHPDAVLEDSLNKPWRPLVTGRITTTQARRLLLASLPIVLAINWYLGAWRETALLFTLTWMYNDLQGGEDDFVVRNLIIAFAFGLYNGGALRIAAGPDYEITTYGYAWVVLINAVIFTTMHVQDMKDQDGDRARGRRSAPLILGYYAARWTIAVSVILWSSVCPPFLALPPWGYFVPCAVGSIIVGRLFGLRSIHADRRTWQLWTAWTAFLYLLPLMKSPGVFLRSFPIAQGIEIL